jgi:nucleoside-diphosphate-sugar epimerase
MPGVKNICLTGAAGFIGTNLADVLKNRTDLNIIPSLPAVHNRKGKPELL